MKNIFNILKKFLDRDFYIRLPHMIKFRIIRFYHEKFIFKFASKETVFTSIWRNNYWGDNESLSGVGSTIDQTAELRQKMPLMFKEYGIKSIFDAPCGDLNWMQHLLKNADFSYLGGDIVSELIAINSMKFKNESVNFIKFDITSDVFPAADMWLCRAVLYHLSNQDIYLALERFIESDVKYILTTNCVTDSMHVNKDISTGDWRSLNLMLPPFNFPKDPLWEIDDYVDPHPPMKICLWTREQINVVMLDLRKIYN